MNYMKNSKTKTSIDARPKTIFCDIDGVLFKHYGLDLDARSREDTEVLNGVKKTFRQWESNGYNIILVTGRRESEREVTKKQLEKARLKYDKLIMGIGGGVRVLINDKKPTGENTAISFNLNRNEGLSSINI